MKDKIKTIHHFFSLTLFVFLLIPKNTLFAEICISEPGIIDEKCSCLKKNNCLKLTEPSLGHEKSLTKFSQMKSFQIILKSYQDLVQGKIDKSDKNKKKIIAAQYSIGRMSQKIVRNLHEKRKKNQKIRKVIPPVLTKNSYLLDGLLLFRKNGNQKLFKFFKSPHSSFNKNFERRDHSKTVLKKEKDNNIIEESMKIVNATKKKDKLENPEIDIANIKDINISNIHNEQRKNIFQLISILHLKKWSFFLKNKSAPL